MFRLKPINMTTTDFKHQYQVLFPKNEVISDEIRNLEKYKSD